MNNLDSNTRSRELSPVGYKLVGIAGKARSGKTTAAEALEAHGYHHDSFAAPIREFVAKLCGLTIKELDKVKDTTTEPFGVTPRVLMQSLGTQWAREHNPEFWLIALQHRSSCGYTVISDVRFENEAEFIRSNGGLLIHVQRPSAPIAESGHISERPVEVKQGDALIVNNSTIDVFTKHVIAAVSA